MKFSELQKREDSVQQSLLLWMSGAGAPIFFAFTKLFMSGYVCKRRESDMFIHTFLGWRRGPLFWLPNFFPSLFALTGPPTTSFRQRILRSGWAKFFAQHR